MVTFLLSLLAIGGIALMLYSAVALVQDKRLFGSAPKDVQELVQPKPERFKGQHLFGWTLLILSLLMLAAVLVLAVWDGIRNNFGFWQFFARFLIILYAYKAFDMLCFDWLLLTRSHFFQHYYPEIEGCDGCTKYGFNLRSQIIRIIVYPFICAFIAWICTLMQ
ncbi:MAG: hypothetical protein NC429_08370 [Lachnospiraceae bacterium]|nr:hypothetical protein [Lachnospiraceae bacterium]MCM1233655.1 hypothetical protein [Ruminococcus flavefaciens]